jgi:hypothetical protein
MVSSMSSWPRSKKGFWRSILLLIGHLASTALVFSAILSFGWGASFVFGYLNSVRNFPPEIFTLFTRLEIGLFYIDTLASGIVLLAGVVRFVRDALEDG